MECPLYQNERYCLFRNLRETHKNIETLLFETVDGIKDVKDILSLFIGVV
jgi:hypothetical protein